MKYLPITEVCGFQGGTQPPKREWSEKPFDGYIRMLQIRDFTQPERTTSEFVKKSKKLKTCSSDDVLIGRYGASIGKILTGLSGAYNVAIIRTIPDETKLSKLFLHHLLKDPVFQGFIENVGARAAQAGFNKTDLSKFNIPDISLDDQIRIAHLLGKVEGLIAQRKQSLQQLDELLKSVFLEMFGDPVRNEKGWDDRPCTEVVINIQSGTSYGGEAKVFLNDDEYGVLKISAVTQGHFNSKEFKAVKKASIKKPLRFVKNGDFLFSRANTVELVGACCIVDNDYPKLFIPDKLWVLSFAGFIKPQYFNFLLKNENFRNQLRKKASGGHDSMLNISMRKFLSLTIPVPSPGLQEQFTAIVEKVGGIKSEYQKSLNELKKLYGVLSQKAFKGELDLSRVVFDEVVDSYEKVAA